VTTCKDCGDAIHEEVERALDGTHAVVWAGAVSESWICPVTGNEHSPGEPAIRTIILRPGEDHWVRVVMLSGDDRQRPVARVGIISTDEGIVLDLWPDDDLADDVAASTYAFDEDLIPDR
jgi:hypothetical protein